MPESEDLGASPALLPADPGVKSNLKSAALPVGKEGV